MEKDTLYYDGACPICRAEVKKLAGFTKGTLDLRDIHALDGEDSRLDKTSLLSRLHLRTAQGEWITGLQANIRAWRHTPFGFLWLMLDWPLIRIASHACYELWLRHRNRSSQSR